MASDTKIEWTDATVNPIRARNIETGRTGHWCAHVSPGCANCYSEAFQPRFGNPVRFAAQDRAKVDLFLDGAALLKPLRWRKPRRIFWNSMTDLFGDWVPGDWIDRHLAVMALTPHHTHQILTKRPERMRDVIGRLHRAMTNWHQSRATGEIPAAPELIDTFPHFAGAMAHPAIDWQAWPLPNVWLGTSVENQEWADRRRDDLAALAAAGWKTFVSYEPALGPVGWRGWEFLRWLISGGESGSKARPSHPDWHRAARDFAQANGIPYFFKQWGAFRPPEGAEDLWAGELVNRTEECGYYCDPDVGHVDHGAAVMMRVGKSRAGLPSPKRSSGFAQAGRLLDGREWNEVPAEASAKAEVPK